MEQEQIRNTNEPITAKVLIRHFCKLGMSDTLIATELNSKRLKTPTGLKWNNSTVANKRKTMGIRKFSSKKSKNVMTKPIVHKKVNKKVGLENLIQSIIGYEGKTVKSKTKMIMELFQ